MIELRDITPDNHLEVRALAVFPEQQHLVATVDKSLADGFIWKDALLRAAYHDNTAVGFVCVFPFEENGRRTVNVVRLLIDSRHQGQGLGRALFGSTLKWVESLSPDRIRISTLPENEVALSLYKSMGFVEAGIEDGEIALYLDCQATSD